MPGLPSALSLPTSWSLAGSTETRVIPGLSVLFELVNSNPTAGQVSTCHCGVVCAGVVPRQIHGLVNEAGQAETPGRQIETQCPASQPTAPPLVMLCMWTVQDLC
jgi:hypothetical protein